MSYVRVSVLCYYQQAEGHVFGNYNDVDDEASTAPVGDMLTAELVASELPIESAVITEDNEYSVPSNSSMTEMNAEMNAHDASLGYSIPTDRSMLAVAERHALDTSRSGYGDGVGRNIVRSPGDMMGKDDDDGNGVRGSSSGVGVGAGVDGSTRAGVGRPPPINTYSGAPMFMNPTSITSNPSSNPGTPKNTRNIPMGTMTSLKTIAQFTNLIIYPKCYLYTSCCFSIYGCIIIDRD